MDLVASVLHCNVNAWFQLMFVGEVTLTSKRMNTGAVSYWAQGAVCGAIALDGSLCMFLFDWQLFLNV